MQFSQSFIWGCAAASYQIEGSVTAEGRGKSIWDKFSHTAGKTVNGDTGDVACDHFHRYKEDIALMKELGIDSYRFSIAWPRILPEGRGVVNHRGLDFYKRLVDHLNDAGIIPMATLYHWDLPQALQDMGGWDKRDTSFLFAEYAEICFRSLSDGVPFWVTLNEPWCSAILGYEVGVHAPGIKDKATAYRAVHHLLLAHGKACEVWKQGSYTGKIGITLNLSTPRPLNNDPANRQAADRSCDGPARMYLNPLFGKPYPQRHLDAHSLQMPIQEGDMISIAQPLDFLGMNYYTEPCVEHNPKDPEEFRNVKTDLPQTDMGWDIVADGLYRQLLWVKEEYDPPEIYITENGAAYPDELKNGQCKDPQRIDYLSKHLEACEKAIQQKVPLKGYYLWSFIDNFEWSLGYTKRFGLVYCDFATQKRIPKDSFYWYKNFISR